MADRNEDEPEPEPVGRGCGLAVLPPLPPPPNPPFGAVTPCCWRHCWKLELCDVPEVEVELELVEPPPQAATDTTVASATALSATGLTALGPGLPSAALNKRIKRFLLTARGRRVPRPPGRVLMSRHIPVKEARLAISLWLPHGFVSST
ncbi:MAG: hypothetical protein JWM19_1113 [Actinomycetia bacterium]|nr:hypothetical protein [Actinomycetes bacterium]